MSRGAAPGESIDRVETAEPSRWRQLLLGRDGVMVLALLLALVIASLTITNFASPITVGFLLLDVIPTLLIALPMTLIIVTEEMDLSVASTAGLTSAVLGVTWAATRNLPLAIALALGAAVLCGFFNATLIAIGRLNSLAVTIGTLALFRGLALVVIGDNAVASFPAAANAFVTSKIGATGIPTVMIGVVALIAVFAVVLHGTPFGRSLFAIGHSPQAARFVGIDVLRTKFVLFVTSGFVSGLAGVYWTLRYSSARSDNAAGLEMAVIAAVLLGGVSIFGGRGSIPGAVSGVLLIGIVNYALRLGRVSEVVLITVTGLLLILSVVTPSIWARVRERRDRIRIRRSMAAITGAAPTQTAGA